MYVAPAGTGTASASHRVAAEATTPTGLRSARVEWEVHVTAAVPKLTLTQPKGPVAKIERGSALPFRAVGRVREGQAIAYEWRVDGAVQAGAGAEEFQLSGDTSSGDHVVEVVAVDAHGLRSAVRRWKVSVLEVSPRPE